MAAAGGGGLLATRALALSDRAGSDQSLHRWTGQALGADSTIALAGITASKAADLIALCRAEIARMDALFSLQRPDSVLSQLNRTGAVVSPGADFHGLVETALGVSEFTRGAFDISVEPVLALYDNHYRRALIDRPPRKAEREAALHLVGHGKIATAGGNVTLQRAGMTLTLNGIAQGFITDHITAILRAHGLSHTLVNLGEYRAMGQHPDKRPWRIGIQDPQHADGLIDTVELFNAALATSGGYGTRFGGRSDLHHLIDPRTGQSANHFLSVTVRHPEATMADALSTAFSILPEDEIRSILPRLGAQTGQVAVVLVRPDGTRIRASS